MGEIAAFVHGRQQLVERRTVRALLRAGTETPRCLSTVELAEALGGVSGIVVIAKSGAWFPSLQSIPKFPPKGEWVAAGASLGDLKWERALGRCGGDLSRLRWWNSAPPAPPAMLLSPAAARRFGALLGTMDIEKVWRSMLRSGVRVAHLPELDACVDDSLRVAQLVTSIQVGGAERVAIDLASGLLITLCKPTRETFPPPRGHVDLSPLRGDPERAMDELQKVLLAFGADVVHAHLIRAAEAVAIQARGFPLMLHIHNVAQGWPPDYSCMPAGAATVLVACAQAVERQLPSMTTRTIWNGVALKNCAALPVDTFKVVTLANPRIQKRLERIPEIARLTAELLAPRRVRFVIAGAMEPHSADSAQAIEALDLAICTHNAAEWIERPGIVGDTASLLADADAMLSVSAYEGLSLAHLEALGMGVPVVATDVGGTSEIHSDALRLLPADASAAEFARELTGCKRGTATLPASFTRQKMIARAAWLAAATSRRAARIKADGLWLVANNFSTGGAQSSARRLLLALKECGVRVRAAVIQEQPQFPTPGRRSLEAQGIPVFAATTTESLINAIESDPPAALFFWNVITSWKVSLADALLEMRVFDVSPGEMLFSSLDRFLESVPAGVPYRAASDYGARLAGIVVKYRCEAARAAKLGCPVSVIRNGVPSFPAAAPGQNRMLVLGTAARLSPDKKLEDLLAAIRLAAPKLPPFVLRIAGGPERDFPHYATDLRKAASGLPVEWEGELTDMGSFLAQLDIFVMISEPAGCPNATLEASAAGLPIVATDHGGACEQVLDGVTGFLAPRGDAAAFSEAVLHLSGNPDRRIAMGIAAREHVQKEFSLSRMADAYLALIHG